MINTNILERAKKLYFEKYGVKLTNEKATELMTDLMNLMKVLSKPDNKYV
jgi:hypothetical protein